MKDNSDIFEQHSESYWVGEKEDYEKYLVKRYMQMILNYILLVIETSIQSWISLF
jgi:hypothetical protein